jgi:hypothetical protein
MRTAMMMFRTHGMRLAVVAAVTLGLAGVASADDTSDDLRMDDAWTDLTVDQEPILTDLQFAKLNNLAFQAAVTKICDGYELDQTKFADGVADATFPMRT